MFGSTSVTTHCALPISASAPQGMASKQGHPQVFGDKSLMEPVFDEFLKELTRGGKRPAKKSFRSKANCDDLPDIETLCLYEHVLISLWSLGRTWQLSAPAQVSILLAWNVAHGYVLHERNKSREWATAEIETFWVMQRHMEIVHEDDTRWKKFCPCSDEAEEASEDAPEEKKPRIMTLSDDEPVASGRASSSNQAIYTRVCVCPPNS